MRDIRTAESTSLGLTVVGNLYADLGTSEAFRAHVAALQTLGNPLNYTQVDLNHVNVHNEAINITRGNQFPVNYFHLNAPEFLEHALPQLGGSFMENRYNIGYWVTERGDHIHDSWLPATTLLDEIWTASNFTKEIIEKSVDIPVQVIPHPIAIQPDASITRQYFGLPDHRFLFLFTFDPRSTSARKNPLGLMEAFKDAFPAQEDAPILVIKTYGLSNFPQLHQAMLNSIQNHNIILIDQYMSRTEVTSLMNICDAYVSLHRSEGFGMALAESMYLGKPVIATGWSGNMDYMSIANSYPVNYDLVPISLDHHQYQDLESIINLYPPDSCTWADPNLDHAIHLMQHVYQNYKDAEIIARYGQKSIHATNSLSTISHVMVERVKSIYIQYPELNMITTHNQQITNAPDHNSEVLFEFDQLIPDAEGWHYPEIFQGNIYFQWTSHRVAKLPFSLTPQSDYTLQFTICNVASEDILDSLRISINNTVIDVEHISLINNLRVYEGFVPQAILAEDNNIHVHTNRVTPVDGADPRSFGLGFMRLELMPIENSTTLLSPLTGANRDLHLQYLFQVWNNTRQQFEVSRWNRIPFLQFVIKTGYRIRNLGNLWADLYRFLVALLQDMSKISQQVSILETQVTQLQTELESLRIESSKMPANYEQRVTALESQLVQVDSRRDLTEAKQIIASLQTHFAKLNQELETLQSDSSQCQINLDQIDTHSQDRYASLSQQLNEVITDIQQLQNKIVPQEQRTFFHTKRDIFQLEDVDNLLNILSQVDNPLSTQSHAINMSLQITRDLDIHNRYDHQRQYIAYLNLKPELRDAPVINFGIEGGEFLSILDDIGLSGIGVDDDVNKIHKSQNNSFTVKQTDSIGFLRSCQNNTLQGIYANDIVQTLEWDDYITFLNLANEKLAEGGFILIETFNPLSYESLSRFYMNPQNVKPIPARLLSLCLKVIQFKQIEYFFSQPVKLKIESPSNVNYENYENYAILAYK